MSRTKWLAILVVVAIAVVLVVFYIPRDDGGDVVRFGAVLPLTGDGAKYGQDMQHAIELAVRKANDDGGIHGKTVEFVYEDDGGRPAAGVAALRKLSTVDGVEIAIGGVFSSVALAMVPVADAERILLFSPSASSPKLTGSSELFFRNWPSDLFDGSAMADFSTEELGLSRIAIIFDNGEYGIGLKDAFELAFLELGGEIVASEAYLVGTTDFRAQLMGVLRSDPDALYMVGYYREFATILRQARELGIECRILSCVSFDEPELLQLAREAAEGVIFTRPFYDAGSELPEVDAFATDYRSEFGASPTVFAAHAYDAVGILVEAARTAGFPLSPPEIARVIRGMEDFPGVSGRTSFTSSNDVIKHPQFVEVVNGAFVPYQLAH